MILLFFGTDECRNCNKLLREIKSAKINEKVSKFLYIDALDDNQEEFCDTHNVDELPHIKVYDGNSLIFESIGPGCDMIKLSSCFDDKGDKFNLSKYNKK